MDRGVTLAIGSAVLRSTVRGWDENPVMAFSVHLPSQPESWGIWRIDAAANRNDFNVVIVAFGWFNEYAVGNPKPTTRLRLSASEAADVRTLITALFRDAGARKTVFPFTSSKGTFLGGIEFQSSWILAKP
ncbi:MAG: hypothetical protein JO001_16945 [Alphaproteobacteria bacterium]|nr:hypothetical protein [Alphaproteobacteria bacterium]